MSFDSFQAYQTFYENHREFINQLGLNHEANTRKMRILTFMQIAETQSQISYWPRDCYEYVLLLLIILFEPRYMKKPETVYRMQTYFSELLFKYLLTTSAAEEGKPKALARFGSGIDCISKCVELNDLFTRTNNSDENLFDIILAEL